jgi:hypothetical protein
MLQSLLRELKVFKVHLLASHDENPLRRTDENCSESSFQHGAFA